MLTSSLRKLFVCDEVALQRFLCFGEQFPEIGELFSQSRGTCSLNLSSDQLHS